MRVACVGGGPGGLFLALLLGRDGRHVVDVFDRDNEDATYGFGVVFSRMSVARLRFVARDVVDEILSHGVYWHSLEVRAWGAVAKSSGHGFGAVERQAMLRVLRRHAVGAGVRIFQSRSVEATDLLNTYDIVVAADGAGSTTRRRMAEYFRPTVTYGATRYAWFGADRPFECMTFLLADGGHGLMGAHVYPYSRTASTFLVEASEQVWRNAGFIADGPRPPGWTDENALNYCQKIFSSYLGVATLIGNGSRWLRFAEVRNEHWSAPRVVLLGDAAHTAHFSVGSGTSMAMEDAVELAKCLSRFTVIDEAFRAYEAARRPVTAGIQMAAWASSQFWERLDNEAGRDVDEIMLRLLTRTGQTDIELLSRIDPTLPTVTHRPSSKLFEDGNVVAVPLTSCVCHTRGRPVAVLVQPHEIEQLDKTHPPEPQWTSVALVVDWNKDGIQAVNQTAACLAKLRLRSGGIPTGVFFLAQNVKSPEMACRHLATWTAALRKLARLDFVSIGCRDSMPASRTMQMMLCEFVRSELGLTTIYACLPGHLSHGRTHVKAARADKIWLIQGST
jgi:anthraniloyl-CoA monooxygenase